jgi:3-oxoacyl-(acyl-carrier-protein) synthase
MLLMPFFLCFLQPMIGHCLRAAGALEAIATIKSITTGWVHPTIDQFVSAQLLPGSFGKL